MRLRGVGINEDAVREHGAMVGSSQTLIMVAVAIGWVAVKSLKDMLCSQMV